MFHVNNRAHAFSSTNLGLNAILEDGRLDFDNNLVLCILIDPPWAAVDFYHYMVRERRRSRQIYMYDYRQP